MDSMILWIGGAAVLGGVAIVVFALMRLKGGVDVAGLETKMADLAKAQGEIAGRFAEAIERQSKDQSALQTAVNERLGALDQRLGESLKESGEKTAETLGGLQARLKAIDEAQKNLTDLSSQVVGLQQILANKQTRGAWGQGQMEAIVRDALPAGMYEFQFTLPNRSRPDCVISLPGVRARIVIDSKFPLEGFEQLKAAANEAERKTATARIKTDVVKHVRDIAEKYLIAGETQEPALMFVPSESIYADLYENFGELIQNANKQRVVIVSPNLLLLAINTIKTVLKDARMREQATLIQKEVGLLMDDVNRLYKRATNLQSHFGQAENDVKELLTSAEKIVKRGSAIEQVDVAPAVETPAQQRAPSLFADAG